MDRRQLNLAAHIIDPVSLLCHLWALANQAMQNGCELPVDTVINYIKRTISLVGNVSFCANNDRRKALLVKMAPDCLDILDRPRT